MDAVIDELSTRRDYEAGGMDISKTLMAVVSRTEWDLSYSSDPKDYLGKLASVDGQTLTVGEISKGSVHVRIELADEEAAR
jgi:hypothetical protein